MRCKRHSPLTVIPLLLLLTGCAASPAVAIPSITALPATGTYSASPSGEPHQPSPSFTATAVVTTRPTATIPSVRGTATSVPPSATIAQPPDVGITIEEDSLIPPIPPASLTGVWTGQVVQLTWRGTGDDTLQTFTVYRHQGESEWTAIGSTPFVQTQADFAFEDSAVSAGSTYEYAVTATNQYGKESQFSTSMVITIP